MAWADEGIECYVSNEKKGESLELPSEGGKKCTCYVSARISKVLVPLYHLYNQQYDDHLYCTSSEEVDEFKGKGYKDQGRAGCVRPHKVGTHDPLFRAYDPDAKRHFYTTDVTVIDKNGPTLTRDALEKVLKEKLDGYFAERKDIFLADDKYFCTTRKTAEAIIKEAKVNDKEYFAPDVGDCDDYAHLLKSAFIVDAWIDKKRSLPYAFGILWGGQQDDPANHAMNFVIVSGGDGSFELWVIEPKDSTWYEPSKKKLESICLVIC